LLVSGDSESNVTKLFWDHLVPSSFLTSRFIVD
jgi:hypothetical protein